MSTKSKLDTKRGNGQAARILQPQQPQMQPVEDRMSRLVRQCNLISNNLASIQNSLPDWAQSLNLVMEEMGQLKRTVADKDTQLEETKARLDEALKLSGKKQ